MDISINIVTFILTQLLASGVCTPSCGNVCFYNSQYRIADCSEVELDRIPSHHGCTGASFLDLSFNAISSLQNNSFQRYSHVENLDISSNAIIEIQPLAFVGLHAVTNIDLSQNHITMLPSYIFHDVKDTIDQIHLERNEIAELADSTFTNLTKLTALFLGYNRMTTLSPNLFRDLSALLRLHVNSNGLTHISNKLLEPFHHLKILDLSSNSIVEVPSTLFEFLPSCIETITLANNRLRYIPKPHGRESSMSPQTLDIRNNNITDATNITYFFGETEKLLLEGNPFRCDCSFNDVREWIQRDELSRTACTWTCVHPVTMETVLARDLTAGDTLCPETTTVKIAATSSPPEDVVTLVDSKEMQEKDRPYPIVVVDNFVSPMPVDINITDHSFISVLNDWPMPLPVAVTVLVVLLLLVMIVMVALIIALAICLGQTNKQIERMTDAIINSQKTPKAVRDLVDKLKDIGTPKSIKKQNNFNAKQNDEMGKENLLEKFDEAEHLCDEITLGEKIDTKSSKNENNSIAKQDDGMVKEDSQSEFAAAEVNLPEEECQVNTDKESGKINKPENHPHDKETTLDENFGTESSKNENNSIAKQDDGMVKEDSQSELTAAEVNLPEEERQVDIKKENGQINITENYLHDKETTLQVDESIGTKSALSGQKDGLRKRTTPKGKGSDSSGKLKTKTDKENVDKVNVRSTPSGGTNVASRKTTLQDSQKNKNDQVQNTRKKGRKLEDQFNDEQSPLITDTKMMQKLASDNETRKDPKNPFTDVTNRDKVSQRENAHLS